MNPAASAPTHWCRVGNTFIFLDLTRDRYFALEPSAAAHFAQILHCDQGAGELDWLAARGLQNLAPPIARTCPELIAPTCSILEDPELQRASAADTVRSVLAGAMARRHVRNVPLAKILSELPRTVPVAEPVQRSEARRAAAAFQRARHYLSGIDECLSRGIAMRRALARKGCEARLVIGVTLPFAAHCWAQLGPAVLTDPLDVVTPYTPILVA